MVWTQIHRLCWKYAALWAAPSRSPFSNFTTAPCAIAKCFPTSLSSELAGILSLRLFGRHHTHDRLSAGLPDGSIILYVKGSHWQALAQSTDLALPATLYRTMRLLTYFFALVSNTMMSALPGALHKYY